MKPLKIITPNEKHILHRLTAYWLQMTAVPVAVFPVPSVLVFHLLSPTAFE